MVDNALKTAVEAGDGYNALKAAVEALPRPWQATYFAVVESTQDEARAASRRGAPHRSIFVADYQRAGRGRQGRTWVARPGVALMLSVVFRESAAAAVPWRWTSLASVALAEAIVDLLPALRPDVVLFHAPMADRDGNGVHQPSDVLRSF